MPFGFRFTKTMPLPPWAPFFSREKLEAFVNHLGEYFRKRHKSKIKFEKTDVPRITVSGGTFPPGHYELEVSVRDRATRATAKAAAAFVVK